MIKLLSVLALAVFPQVAEAASYTVTYSAAFPMKATSVPTGWPNSVPLGVGVLLGRCQGSSCPYDGTETTVAAKSWNGSSEVSWGYTPSGGSFTPYAKCITYVKDGYNLYYLEFAAPPPYWPSSWPTELRCSVSDANNSLLFKATNITTNSNYAGPSSYLPGSTLSFSSTWTMTFTAAGSARETIWLPVDNYVDQTVNCKKNNGSWWTDVSANVEEDGSNDRIQLRVGKSAVEASGYCTINKNGVATSFDVAVDRP